MEFLLDLELPLLYHILIAVVTCTRQDQAADIEIIAPLLGEGGDVLQASRDCRATSGRQRSDLARLELGTVG